MRTVVQRVQKASVQIDGKTTTQIDRGLLILVGIEHEDQTDDIAWLVRKIVNMRIFSDEKGVMNLSLRDVDGDAMVVSQFTLHAAVKKGNRPSYIKAAKPETAVPLYEEFIATFEKALGKKIDTGTFGADMQVELVNDGPVTILMDSKNRE